MNGDEHRTAAPDWDALTLELHCPRCGYNLRGLPQPRCPECGREFEWVELVTGAQTETESPLFEYQWRRRPVRSFLVTVGASILPIRFWYDASLFARPRLGPLTLFLGLVLTLQGLICGVSSFAPDWSARIDPRWAHASWLYVPSLSAELFGQIPTIVGELLVAALCCLAWRFYQRTEQSDHAWDSHVVRAVVLALTGFAAWRTASVVARTVLHLACLWDVSYVAGGPAHWLETHALWFDFVLPAVVYAACLASGIGHHLQSRR